MRGFVDYVLQLTSKGIEIVPDDIYKNVISSNEIELYIRQLGMNLLYDKLQTFTCWNIAVCV